MSDSDQEIGGGDCTEEFLTVSQKQDEAGIAFGTYLSPDDVREIAEAIDSFDSRCG